MTSSTVEGKIPLEVIGAWQEKLKEVLEAKSAWTIRIKERNEPVKLIIRDAVHTLLVQELLDFVLTDVAIRVTVNALEGRVRSKVCDATETLTSCF